MESTPRDPDNNKEDDNSVLSLHRSRHIAREALRREESGEPRPFSESAEEEHEAEKVAMHSHDRLAERIHEIDMAALTNANRIHDRRQRAPEAKQLHGEVEARGHIGHVLMTAESPKRNREASQPEPRVELSANKRIETLSRSELLTLSEQIAVEGSSLRNVYETHLIGEQALRRLIAEYLHGGDIQKALVREIIEHEIDFERDPALRDMSVPPAADDSDAQQMTAPGKESLDHLLQKAGADIGANDELVTYDTSDTEHESKQLVQRYPQQRPLDVMMGVTIVALIIVVVALYFWHH